MSSEMERFDRDLTLSWIAESVVQRRCGIQLDGRLRCDGCGCGLSVDFHYSSPAPGCAIELTNLVDTAMRDTFGAGLKRKDGLAAQASSAWPGQWTIAVRARTRLQALEDDLKQIMAAMHEHHRGDLFVGGYSSEELIDADRLGTGARNLVALHERLKRKGLRSVHWSPRNFTSVDYVVMSETNTIGSFEVPLMQACQANAPKLALARPRMTVLCVDVARWDASEREEVTSVPKIPNAIDVLIVVHSTRIGGSVWMAQRGDRDWTVENDVGVPVESYART